MTYQELIKCYPWIDLAWEVFKGVSPTAIALATIFVTEFFVRKRNKVDKNKEMELQYLEKILSWIHEIRQNVFEISSSLVKVLSIRDGCERVPKFNEVLGQVTEMNKSVFVLSDTYEDIISGMGYNFELDHIKDAVNNYSKTINEIGVKYLESITTKEATDEINYITVKTSEEMKVSSSLITSKINLLYGNAYNHVKLRVNKGGKRKFTIKKKLYTPYGFDEKVEYKIYSHIGEGLRKVVLGKGVRKKNENYPSFDSYMEWKKYFVNKFSGGSDWNGNFSHYLNKKLRISDQKVEFAKSVVVPLYIAEISGLMAIYQSVESICTQIIMLLAAIIITLLFSMYFTIKYSSRANFYAECINIVESIDTSHQK